MKHLATLLLLFLFVSCEQEQFEFSNNTSNINIFLIQDVSQEIHTADFNLNTVKLEENPWVKSSDIEFYDWSAHTFFLNKEIEKEKHAGKHFVVTSGNERLFAGVFFPMNLSSKPQIPYILAEDGYFNPKDVIQFGQFGSYRAGNINENDTFKNALKRAGLFRAGIEVELTGIKKINASSVEYAFTVTNLDEENLYILDPQKMGQARFHYYTNGVSLVQNESYYWATSEDAIGIEKIKSDWFYKLSPGKSVSRKVIMDGFSKLPTGEVDVTFRFPGAPLTKTGEWKKPDGRIWLGDYYTRGKLNMQ